MYESPNKRRTQDELTTLEDLFAEYSDSSNGLGHEVDIMVSLTHSKTLDLIELPSNKSKKPHSQNTSIRAGILEKKGWELT